MAELSPYSLTNKLRLDNIGQMNRLQKISLVLATLLLALALFTDQIQAQDENCVTTYGGGQICGAHTPVYTGADSTTLYTLSAILYGAGLTSLVLAKNADKLVPFLK